MVLAEVLTWAHANQQKTSSHTSLHNVPFYNFTRLRHCKPAALTPQQRLDNGVGDLGKGS